MSSTLTTHPVSAHAHPSKFSSIPVLDFSLASSPSTKPLFISQLRDALINVGFLYLSNHTVPASTVEAFIDYIPKLFALPQEVKEKIALAHSPTFLGYSRLGEEMTKGKTDHREEFAFGSRPAAKWSSGPDYWRMWGPSQWLDESVLPGFRAVLELYMAQLHDLNKTFNSLFAESFSLPPDALDKFYDTEENMQHRVKIIEYPPVAVTDPTDDHGLGPHFDPGFVTFVLQASSHQKGLQVQSLTGEWIDVPPVPGTFVINIGRALEFVTQGVARCATHRVLSPRGEVGPRYSVPFIQDIGMDIHLVDHVLDIPPDVLKLKEGRADAGIADGANLAEYDREPSGKVVLMARVKTHPQVAERHYPELFKKSYPEGLPRSSRANGVAAA